MSGLRLLPMPLVRRLRILDQRARGTRFLERDVTTILNPPAATGMGWWSLNPYIGCEFGCSYCYARFAHRYASERAREAGDGGLLETDASPVQAFETRIFVKRRDSVLAALDRGLPRLRTACTRGGRTIVIGTSTDPYQPAERNFRVTHAVLERLGAERGLHVEIITKSPLVTRDAPLLGELSKRHDVSVNISIISADADIVRAFEPKSPMPHARLRALRRLADHGVRAGILVAPILPGVTDSRAHLAQLLTAARAAGAAYAHYAPFRFYPGLRGLLYPALQAVNPALPPRYDLRFPNPGHAPANYRAALSLRFRALAADAGFPPIARYGTAPINAPATQLGLWEDEAT